MNGRKVYFVVGQFAKNDCQRAGRVRERHQKDCMIIVGKWFQCPRFEEDETSPRVFLVSTVMIEDFKAVVIGRGLRFSGRLQLERSLDSRSWGILARSYYRNRRARRRWGL